MNRQHHAFQAIDPLVLMKAVGDDASAFRELSETFLRIAPPMVSRLGQAVAAGDLDSAVMESHSLKSTTALVGAAKLTSLVEALERLARSGDSQGIAATLPQLVAEFALVMQEVRISEESARPASATVMP